MGPPNIMGVKQPDSVGFLMFPRSYTAARSVVMPSTMEYSLPKVGVLFHKTRWLFNEFENTDESQRSFASKFLSWISRRFRRPVGGSALATVLPGNERSYSGIANEMIR